MCLICVRASSQLIYKYKRSDSTVDAINFTCPLTEMQAYGYVICYGACGQSVKALDLGSGVWANLMGAG